MDYKKSILTNVVTINQIPDQQYAGRFSWLSDSIYNGKTGIKINTIDYIIANILDRRRNIYKFENKQSFDLYVIGSFRKSFNPTLKVAEALADFYLETKILPNIIPIPKHIYLKNLDYFRSKIKNGVLIYERR